MCQACVDAVKKWFPKVAEADYHDLLMSSTCFPMGGADDVERQLKEMAEKGIETVEAASAYACEEMFKVSREMNATSDDRTKT